MPIARVSPVSQSVSALRSTEVTGGADGGGAVDISAARDVSFDALADASASSGGGADTFSLIVLLARHFEINLETAVDRKWFKYLKE